MALTDRIEFTLTVKNDRQIEILRKRVILEDNEFLTEKNFRFVLEPGDDVSQQPALVRQIANLIWTPQVIAEYRARKDANQP